MNKLDAYEGKTRLTIISIILVLSVMYFAKTLILPILISVFFALLLNPVVCLLRRIYIPRSIASILVVSAFIISIGTFFSFLIEPGEKWISKVPEITEQLSKKIDEAAKPFTQEEDRPWYAFDKEEEPPVSGRVMSHLSNLITQVLASSTPVFFAQILTVIVLVLFFLIHGNDLYRNCVAALSGFARKRCLVVIGRSIQFEISRYVFIISLINLSLGAATAAVLYFLGVEDALLWGALATLFNYVPYIGPFAMTILLTMVGYVQYGSGIEIFKIPIAFTILNNIECQFVTPTILGGRFKVNPLIVVLWLLIVGWMWGVAGMILAVPILVSFKILVKHAKSLSYWRSLLS